MTISSHFYEAYLKCPTKCFLRALGEMGTGNAYVDWVRTQNASYRTEESQRLRQRATRDQCVIGPPAAANLKSAKWNLAIDLTVRTDHLQSTIHAVERVVSQERGKPTQLIPIRFIYADRLTREDRLLVAFDALVLSETLGREVGLGKIIHGDKSATLEVKTGALASEVRKRTEKISALLSSKSPPDLVLNRHCPECEFQTQCRQSYRGRRPQPLIRDDGEGTREPPQQGNLHRHAAVLHFQTSQNAKEGKEPCQASLHGTAGARDP